jgi:hypothetical protein
MRGILAGGIPRTIVGLQGERGDVLPAIVALYRVQRSLSRRSLCGRGICFFAPFPYLSPLTSITGKNSARSGAQIRFYTRCGPNGMMMAAAERTQLQGVGLSIGAAVTSRYRSSPKTRTYLSNTRQ